MNNTNISFSIICLMIAVFTISVTANAAEKSCAKPPKAVATAAAQKRIEPLTLATAAVKEAWRAALAAVKLELTIAESEKMKELTVKARKAEELAKEAAEKSAKAVKAALAVVLEGATKASLARGALEEAEAAAAKVTMLALDISIARTRPISEVSEISISAAISDLSVAARAAEAAAKRAAAAGTEALDAAADADLESEEREKRVSELESDIRTALTRPIAESTAELEALKVRLAAESIASSISATEAEKMRLVAESTAAKVANAKNASRKAVECEKIVSKIDTAKSEKVAKKAVKNAEAAARIADIVETEQEISEKDRAELVAELHSLQS